MVSRGATDGCAGAILGQCKKLGPEEFSCDIRDCCISNEMSYQPKQTCERALNDEGGTLDCMEWSVPINAPTFQAFEDLSRIKLPRMIKSALGMLPCLANR